MKNMKNSEHSVVSVILSNRKLDNVKKNHLQNFNLRNVIKKGLLKIRKIIKGMDKRVNKTEDIRTAILNPKFPRVGCQFVMTNFGNRPYL